MARYGRLAVDLFRDSHSEDWSPSQMHEIFTQKAKHIEKAQLGDWQRVSREKKEASLAADEIADI